MKVAAFIKSLISGEKVVRLTDYIDPDQELPVIRRRKEFAQSMLADPVFNDAIRMMNEQIMDEMGETDPLDTKRLTMLRLRLQTVSEFPQTLAQFIDAYEQMVVEQRQRMEQIRQQEEIRQYG